MKTNRLYPLLALPLAMVGLPLYVYLPTYYTLELGYDIALVGMMIFLARLFDIISDPIIGYLSDKSVVKYHSRKPLILIGAFIILLSFYMLIFPSDDKSGLYLFLWSCFIYLGWSFIIIPYLTWSAELSHNYNETTNYNTSREIFTLIGTLIALVVPVLASDGLYQSKLFFIYVVFVLFFIPFLFLTLFKLKPKKAIITQSISLFEIKNIYKNTPELSKLHLGYFINNLANAIPATLFLLFCSIVIDAKEYSEILLLIYFFSGIIGLVFWDKIASYKGKKQTWIYSILLASFSFVFVIFLGAGDIILFGIICFISGLSLGADMAYPTALKADIIRKNRLRHSGFLFGLWSTITKFALAFSLFISFGLLALVGFEESNITSLSYYMLIFCYAILPVFLKLFALYFIKQIQDEITQ